LSRAAFLFVLCVILPAAFAFQPAQAGAADAVFGTATAASVWAAALTYIAPRSLEPLSIPQMTIWGLQGLTALDPDLNATLQDGQIRLYSPDQLLIAVTAPGPDDPRGWGAAAAAVAAAGYAASPALQQAGTGGLIASFFDELFNHFDPYSRYEPPLQAAQDQLMITGIAGAGLTLGREGNDVVITDVAADSPASEAGLDPGIQVLSINGQPAYASEVAKLNANLGGIFGSKVTLRVQDPDSSAGPADIVLTRAFVPAQTVFSEDFADPAGPNFLTLKITNFNKGTSDQFTAALGAGLAASPPPSGLVIDLRGDRGGVLRQAILTADSLLPSGTIVIAAGRDPDAGQRFTAEGGDITAGLPMVVLVDGQTASAAEILAAALADNRRAVVVGSSTLGKGLVQAVTSLPDGGELFITWSRVLAPRGWPLQTLGVIPQICTSLGEQQLDLQLTALKNGTNLMAQADARARAGRAPMPIDQVLAIRNTCPADIGGDLDIAAARFLMASPAAYQAALLPPAAR
jgi:carboxyl-terminal processing protease